MSYFRILQFLFVSLALSSCSVKEDRASCPCWLVVYVDDMPGEGLAVSAWDGRFIFSENISGTSACYETEVPRERLLLSAFARRSSLDVTDSRYVIDFGCECDSLFSYGSTLDCDTDFLVDTVKLNKQFATLNIHLNSTSGSFDYRLRVIGNVSGVDLLSSRPIMGEFMADLQLDSTLSGSVRVPRQKDSSLVLEFLDGDGTVSDLPLGRMMEDYGYDWKALNLSDMTIIIDYSMVTAELNVYDWKITELIECTI